MIIIIIILAANRRRKLEQRRSPARSHRKLTKASLVAAIRSMCTAYSEMESAVGKPENPEKNPRSREEKQRREPRQTQPLMASGPGIEPGGECSHHCAIPASHYKGYSHSNHSSQLEYSLHVYPALK